MKSIIIFTVAVAAMLGVTPIMARAQTTAAPARAFLDSIGINSAISKRGEKLAKTIEVSKYLGLGWFRSGYESALPVGDLIELHRQTGVRFSYGLASGGTNLDRLLDGARRLAAADALIALEGNNEPNNWGITFEWQAGGRSLSWLPVARQQAKLYELGKSDPVLREYPVWSASEIGAEKDNAGLQFLKIPASANCLMPEGTVFADAANCHNYITHPGWSGLHDNQTWVAADPGKACRVDGLFGNHGATWAHHYQGYTESELLTLPRVTTETGVVIDDTVTEEKQAVLYLSVYLDQFKRGWSHTAIYLLRDRSDEGGNQSFGFYKADYTPRKAAFYLHNLTTILADDRAVAGPEAFDYSIPNEPVTVHDLLLQKSDGTFELVLWDERFTGGADHLIVNLATPAASVKVYDPTAGTTPLPTLSQAAVTLNLSDHPVIIELRK